jgi:uncharacterized membrane protein YuzA (DUF378 family)
MADSAFIGVAGHFKIKIIAPLKNNSNMLTVILYLAGIAGFALFYKFIDWFEKI